MKYYVTMTDKFMSGWGQAHNKVNKLIVECADYLQARQIAKAACRRPEMKYVNICINRPRYGAHILESWKTYEQMSGPWKEQV
jgi:hypothetical protein